VNFDSEKAAQLCEDLSLARGIPNVLRSEARHQLHFHLKTAPWLFPSWKVKRLAFTPPPGWRQMNPSVTTWANRIFVAMRCTNYMIDDRGPHPIEGTPNFSRTFLLHVEADSLKDRVVHELFLPEGEARKHDGAPGGFEDMRIFPWKGDLWGIMVRCDQNEEGWPEQWLGRLEGETFAELRKLPSPGPRRPEKNWVPVTGQSFIYSCDPLTLVTEEGRVWDQAYPRIAADHFRGSSQLVQSNGGGLFLVHSVTMHKGWPKNQHRFVWVGPDWRIAKISDAFLFPSVFGEGYLNGYQYGMGLSMHPDRERLLLSYSIGDGSSWLATLAAAEVESKLREV